MTDVFISYSRRDKIFTQKLVDALQAANREVWADWASIPAASDWDAEIKEGIEKTNTVLFVLSPEWIKSNECRKELLHALQMGKKLIPILYIMPDQGQEVPPELAKINWVYMRETDDFNKAFEILQSAMDTDLDWIKIHTRVQVRAIEWNKKNRDNSLTLRGNDLSEGEQFMSQGSGKNPEPTPLQGEFILASRKDATRRQRITLAGVSVALIISIALGVVAYFQRQAAVLNSKISFARELIAASENSIEADPERSLLLVLQAIQITTDAKQEVLPSAEDALRNALQSSRVRHTVLIPNDSVIAVAFSPDGRFAAAGTEKGKLFVWKVFNIAENPGKADGNVGSIWLEEAFTTPESGQAMRSIAFSPDGKFIATSTDDTGTPTIWETETGKISTHLSGDIGTINQIVFSPRGNYLATGGDDGTVRVWDPNTGAQISINGDHGYAVRGIAFSPDETLVASTGESGRIILSYTKDGTASYSSEADPWQLNTIAFSPRGDLVAFGSRAYNLKILDLNTKTVLNTKFHKGIISGTAFSPDGSLVISTGLDDKGIALDPYTGKRVFVLSGDTSAMLAVAFSPDGKYIATGNEGGEFKIWDASIIPPAEAGVVASQQQPATGLGFFDNGERLITSGDEPQAHLYNLEDQSSIPLYNSPKWINDVAVSMDQKYTAISDETGVVSVWDTNTGEKVTEFSASTAPIYDVEFSPDGSRLVGAGDFAYIWDIPSGELSSYFDTGAWNWSSTFSPDGKTLAVGNDSGTLMLFNIESGTKLWEVNAHAANIRSLAFTPDGTSLVSGGFDSEAISWDAATGKELQRFSGHTAGITNLDISPDGKLLATSSSDSTAKVWDLAKGDLLYTLSANKFYEYFWVNNVAFSPDGKLLATGSEDGLMRFYFTSMNDVLALASSRITRSLTAEECKMYLHTDLCPDNLIQPEQQPANRPDGMESLVPLPPIEEVLASNPNLKSNGTQAEINLDVRNKTTISLTLFWVDENGAEQTLGTIAPSEVLRFQSWSGNAFRLRDSQNYIVMEYFSTSDPYQQINIRSTPHLISQLTTSTVDSSSTTGTGDSTSSGIIATQGLKSGDGSTAVTLKITNEAGNLIKLVWVNFQGVEEDFYTLAPGETLEQGTFNTQAWRLRDSDRSLIFEYIATDQAVQGITINADLTVTAK